MTDKRRRLDKLGAIPPEVTAMTDAELMAVYITDPDESPPPAPRGSPLQQELARLSDAELIAEYERASAEVQALEAEARARTATPAPGAAPEPELLPLPPIEPNPIALQEPATPTPRGDPPGAHVSFALDDCDCMSCARHRRCEREEAATRRLGERDEGEPMIEGSVRFAANATDELRDSLNGGTRR